MGGLFSSDEKPLTQQKQTFHYEPSQVRSTAVYRPSDEAVRQLNRTDYHESSPVRSAVVLGSSYSTNRSYHDVHSAEKMRWQMVNDNYRRELLMRQIIRDMKWLEITSNRCVEPPERSVRNPQLFNISNAYCSQVYTLTPLSQYDPEYLQITRMITNKRNFKVDTIEKIENPFLEKAYELKKIQKESLYFPVEERLLFHGTKRIYVDGICEKNFNWRLCQTHKYGRGVSFSPNSTYASVYSDKNVYQKVMIVAKVLIGRSSIGNESMDIPPEGCDTSQKGLDGIVIVKYEDSDFCPVYKINYHVMNETVGRRNRYKKRKSGFNGLVFDFSFDGFD